MNIKKQIFTVFVTIFFAAPLLKGMEFDFQKFYKSETKTLDLTNTKITVDFLKKNKDTLQAFIFKNAVQKLDLQGNKFKKIPVCIAKIMLENKSPLKEINIVFPKLSVGYRSLFQLEKISAFQDTIKELKLNVQTSLTAQDDRSILTLTPKQ